MCAAGLFSGRASLPRPLPLFTSRRTEPDVTLQQEDPMKYKVALRRSVEGYSVSVPGLPGCWSQGATEDEAISNIQDAIREYLAAREEMLIGADVREVDVA